MSGKKRARNKSNNQVTIEDQPEITIFPVTIDGKSNRKQLILTANLTNKDLVWLGGIENEGIPLQPGEKINLSTDQSLEVIGQVGDWLHVAEIIREVT